MRLTLCAFFCFAISAMTALCLPKIYSPVGKEYNFGDVGPAELHCKIPIINSGTDTLIIKNVNTSCGCTSAPIDKKVLLKGDTAILYISMNAKSSNGLKESYVRIYTNVSHDSVDTIKLKANVIRDLALSSLIFNIPSRLKLNKEFSSEVEITNKSKEPIKLMKPIYNGNDLKIRFNLKSAITLKPEETVHLKAYITPKVNYYSGIVYVPTSSKYVPLLELNLYIQVNNSMTGLHQN